MAVIVGFRFLILCATQGCVAGIYIIRDFVIARDITTKAIICGIPDSTVSPFVVRSRLDCVQQCRKAVARNQTSCVGFNFFSATNTCEMFNFMPNFASTSGCAFYGPDICYTLQHDSNTRVSSEDCSFPYTFGGQLYYECAPMSVFGSKLTRDTVCDVFGCLMKHFKAAICYSMDYKATNVTTSISIPTLPGAIPALTINNWIMIQQKLLTDPSSFDLSWNQYKAGFGTLTGNYWMGNENIYQLTNSDNYMLRIEMLSKAKGWISAEYDMFNVESESFLYEIQFAIPPVPIGVYYGDAGDSMQFMGIDTSSSPPMPPMSPPGSVHGFMPFSTSNAQLPPLNCAGSKKGGWWYNKGYCVYALLNTDTASEFVWKTVASSNYQLTASRMMIRLV